MIEESNNYIEKEVDIAYNNTYKDGSLNIFSFKNYDLFIQKLVLERVFSNIYDDLSELNDKHIELVLDLIRKNKSGSMLSLPNSFMCIVDYNYLKIKKVENGTNNSFCFELKDGLELPNGMKFMNLTNKENGNDTLHLSSLDVTLPLYVRNRQDGDYIELKGSGHKKVKDVFIDYKISKLERDSYPVVVDSNGVIVWIPKLKKSKYDSQNDKMCDIIFKCL